MSAPRIKAGLLARLAGRGAALRATIVDEWRFLRRQKMILLILVGLPLFYPPVISWLYSREQADKRPAILVDHDQSALSREMAFKLDATQGIRIVSRPASLEAGWGAVRRGEAELLIYIPADFSADLKKGKPVKIKLWTNTANMYVYSVSYPALYGVVTDLNERFGRRFFHQQGMPAALAKQRTFPIIQDVRYLFHPTASYGSFFVPGVFIIVMQQLTLITLAFSVGLRREIGEFAPDPARPFEYLEGRYYAHSAFFLYAVAVMLFVVTPLFAWRVENLAAAFALFVAFTVAMMPLSILVAQFCRDRYAAFQLLMFASTPLFMMAGFAWPFRQMPLYVQAIAALFPATPALMALRLIMMKTGALSAIAPYLAWLGVQLLVYLAAAIVVVRRMAARS